MKQILAFIIHLLSKLPENGIKTQLRNLLYQDIVSERILEYPLVFRYLKPGNKRVLDVGCRYSNLVLQMASLGHEVYGIDLQPYEYSHPNLKFVKGDIRKTSFPSNFFDAVTAVSVVEHIGLGYYEKALHPDINGDQKAINEIRRILKKDGQLIFTAPFGLPVVTPSYRSYCQSDLSRLFEKFSRVHYEYFRDSQGCWMPCSLAQASKIDSSQKANGAVLVTCVK